MGKSKASSFILQKAIDRKALPAGVGFCGLNSVPAAVQGELEGVGILC